MSHIYVVSFTGTGRLKVGYSRRNPQGRIESHKRGARAYLSCDSFEEWVSIDHVEGEENEKLLIRWCRERTGTEIGEYFSLPFSDVVEFAESLEKTPCEEEPPSRGGTDGIAQLLMEFSEQAYKFRQISDGLGEHAVSYLLELLNPNTARLDLDPNIYTRALDSEHGREVRRHQSKYGLGASYMDIAAGIAMTSIHAALMNQRAAAKDADNTNLLAEPPRDPSDEVMSPLEYLLWAPWFILDLVDHISDSIYTDPETAQELLDHLKTTVIQNAEKTLTLQGKSVNTYPDGSKVHLVRDDGRVLHSKTRFPWESEDLTEIFGPRLGVVS